MSRTNKTSRTLFVLSGLVLSFGFSATAQAANGPGGFSYEGRLYDSSGNPSTQTVTLTMGIYNPAKTCLLRLEQSAAIDLSQTNGYFSVTVGDNGAVISPDPGLSMGAVFANRGTITGSGGCTYTPAAGDGCYLRITVNDGSAVTTLSPDVAIGSVPYSVVADSAETLQGKTATDLLQVNSSTAQLTQANLESVFGSTAKVSELQALANGASTKYAPMSAASGVTVTNVSGNPSTPAMGSMWYDTSSNTLKYYNGAVMTVGAGGGGSVTSITAGTGLSGGTISTTGTISMPNVGTAGTYFKVTTDAQGRVSSGVVSLAEADVPALTTAGKVSGSAISSGTIGGTTAVSTSGNLQTSSDVTAKRLLAQDNGTNYAGFKAPAAVTTTYYLTLPAALPGTSGQVLSSDTAGNLAWVSAGGGGTVTSVTGTAPVTVGGTAAAPVVSVSQATTSTDGYLSSVDWNSFNNKLSSTLASGKIYIGNGSNVATAVAPSGDVTVSNTGAFTVSKIQGVSVSATAPTAAGQVLRYDGTSSYVPAQLSTGDISGLATTLGNKIDAAQMPANCSANQTLTFSSPTGSWVCSTITALTVAQGGTGSANGSITGTSALNFSAGGTNQNITLTPSGSGATVLNGNVGIGTTSPIAPFHFLTSTGNADAVITSQAGNAELLLTGPSASFYPGVAMSYIPGTQALQITKVTNGSPSSYPWVTMNGATGVYTFSSVTGSTAELKMDLQRSNNLAAMTSGMPMARVAFDGYNGVGYSVSAAMIQGVASENFTATANGSDLLFTTTANGTTAPVERMRISNAGNVGIGTSMPVTSLDLGSRNDAIALPRGTTAQQPVSPGSGWIRYNTTNNAIEFYNGSAWTTLAAGGAALSTAGGTLTGNLTINTGGLTVAAGGATVTGGLNNNSGGITNAGVISGVGPSITGSGALTVAAGGAAQNLTLSSSTNGSVNIGSGNGTSLKVLDGGASTVNYVVAKGAAAGGSPGIGTDGADVNINLTFAPKGMGNTVFMTGNVGMGTSTPSQNLHIASGVNSPAGVLVQNQSAASGAQADYRAKNDTGNFTAMGVNSSAFTAGGLFSANTGYLVSDSPNGINIGTTYSGTGMIRFFTGSGTPPERMRIDANGFVGIGTTAPAQPLDVIGNVRVAGAHPVLFLDGAGFSGGKNWTLNANSGGGTGMGDVGDENAYLRIGASGAPQFIVSGADGRMMVAYPGNQIYLPKSMLDVPGGVGIGMYAGSNPAPANGMIVSGNVGIGTPSPSNRLTIMDNTSAGTPVLVQQQASNGWSAVGVRNAASTLDLAMGIGNSTAPSFPNMAYLMVTQSAPLIIGNNNSERLRIDPSGNIGIGTNAPGATLDVFASTSAPAGHFKNNASSTAPALMVENTSSMAGSGALQVGAGSAPIQQVTMFSVTNMTCTGGTSTASAFSCNTASIGSVPQGTNGSFYNCYSTTGSPVSGTGVVSGGTFYINGVAGMSGSLSTSTMFKCLATTF